jgi:SAM-dependent methyltransferase
MERPRILDIGCGPGAATLALARLTEGEIVGLDTHQPYLDRLVASAEEHGFSDRIRTVNRSMDDMDFHPESFDLIWAEGSIYIIGFDRGLREWRRLLKRGGFLGVHEVVWLKPDPPKECRDFWQEEYAAIRGVRENLEAIPAAGFEVLGHFALPNDAWWEGYYIPLERRIAMLKERYAGDAEALEHLEGQQYEIEMYRRYHEWYGSAFFLMRKV